jgi:uncharacterized membrane protein
VVDVVVNSTQGSSLAQARHYLQTDVEGAMFYSMGLFQRLYNIIDFILLYSLFLFLFYYGSFNEQRKILSINIVLALCFYFVFFIDMVWFFRNMYWVFPLLLMYNFRLYFDCRFKMAGHSRTIGSLAIVVLFAVYSSVTLWRTHLMGLHYDF